MKRWLISARLCVSASRETSSYIVFDAVRTAPIEDSLHVCGGVQGHSWTDLLWIRTAVDVLV
jgi:hypothetical protein